MHTELSTKFLTEKSLKSSSKDASATKGAQANSSAELKTMCNCFMRVSALRYSLLSTQFDKLPLYRGRHKPQAFTHAFRIKNSEHFLYCIRTSKTLACKPALLFAKLLIRLAIALFPAAFVPDLYSQNFLSFSDQHLLAAALAP